MKLVVLLLALLAVNLGFAQESDWEAKAEARAQDLKRKNGNGTDSALKSKLLKMRDEDQGVRERYNAATDADKKRLTIEMESTDERLTAELKRIVEKNGWPTIALVGSKASQAAAVMLIHSPDHAWQEQLMPKVRELADDEKIFGSDIATLTDRVLVSHGKPQAFGTQFKDADGKMIMEPVEDPQRLDERRARYLLPPMSVYRQMLREMYHKPVE